METIRKKTLYGMHMDSFMFIKVVLYDPNDIRRVAAILEVRHVDLFFVFHFSLFVKVYML